MSREDFDDGGPEESYEDQAGVVWTRKLLRRVPVVCCHCKKPLGNDSVLQDEDGSRLMHVDCFVAYNDDSLPPYEEK